MCLVYVVQNPEGRFYIGLSENVQARLAQHNSGESKWTKAKGPWSLVWQRGPTTLSEARKLENLLKQQKGGSGSYQMTGLPRSSSGSQSRLAGSQVQILLPQPM